MDKFILTIFPMIATIGMVYCYIPQIILIQKKKNADSQSIQFWILISIFLLSMFMMNIKIYTSGNSDALFGVISQGANLFLALVILIQTIYFKRGR